MKPARLRVALLVALAAGIAEGPVSTAFAGSGGAGEIVNPKDGYVLVPIPAGEFRMGSPDGEVSPEGDEAGEDEKPRHKVYLDGYYIGKYEVTAAQYGRFRAETDRKTNEQPDPAGPDHQNPQQSAGAGPDRPAINVSWNDAKAYCEWAGLRLPTEAEWEKAARGGTNTWYWWGDKASRDKANYDSDGVTPIGSFPANPYGLFDTAGNVWEWCSDWYSEEYYSISPYRNPPGPASGSTRIHRGGSWMNYPHYIRPAIRYSSAPERWSKLIGFRCAADRRNAGN
jgi:sulfatase modifying factor 1